jgi:DNA-binding XRE family transcriptional regulator
MKKFTEIYYDDALRLAKFLSERTGSDIEPVEMDSVGFPQPAKMEVFEERTPALMVGDYAIAFFKKRTSPDEDLKYRDRTLHRVQLGIKMQEARKRADIDLDQLSAYTGLKVKNLENIEKGRFDVTIDILGNIAGAMGFSIDFVENKVYSKNEE